MLKTLALAALVVAWPASQAAYVEVGLDDPVFTLTDLDPFDGVAASWSEDPDNFFPYGDYLESKEGGVIDGHCARTLQCFTTASRGPALPTAFQSLVFGDYLLSPMTEITASFSAMASTVQMFGEVVTARVGVTLDSTHVSGDGATASLFSAGNDASSGTLTVTYANRTNEPISMYWMSEVSYSARGVAPVPEPETYALMLAGLAGVAWAVRRRRSASLIDGPVVA